VVIVTQNQYLLASKIHHITMDEVVNYVDVRNQHGKNISLRDTHYVIQIIYAPDNVNTNNGQIRNQEEQRECSVTIRTAANAHKVFKDLIQQIREQMPDQLYLDTALERMLSGVNLTTLVDRDEDDKKHEFVMTLKALEKKNDRCAKKVRKPRKTKRTNKKVLRRSK
jgi:hypothetical protein